MSYLAIAGIALLGFIAGFFTCIVVLAYTFFGGRP
jgi:hypothetical protein